jgi:hypothetical protein
MNLYWEKMIGFPLFVLLGGLALDWSILHAPILFLPLIVLYPVIVILMARDPLMDCPHIFYRALVTGIAVGIFCWLQRWPLHFMLIAAMYLTGPNYTEARARLRRFWARLGEQAGRNKDLAKSVGYPAFIFLGAVAVDWSLSQSTALFLCAAAAYFVVVFLIAFDPALLRLPHFYLRLSMGVPGLMMILLYVSDLRVIGSFLVWLPFVAVTICLLVARHKDPWWKAQEERAYNRVFGHSRSEDP